MHLVAAETPAADRQPFSHHCHDVLDGVLALAMWSPIRAMIATGAPRRVITMGSPLSAAFRIREKAWFASRAVTERIAALARRFCRTPARYWRLSTFHKNGIGASSTPARF